jgi:hypothetical protein
MPHEQADTGLEEVADDATFGDIDGIGDNSEEAEDIILDSPDDWSRPIEAKPSKGTKKSTDQVENLEVEEGEINGNGTKMSKKKKDDDDEALTDEELEARETAAKKVAKDGPEEKLNEAPAPVGKILKAKVGDQEVMIDDATTIRHKVDGKMVDVKIADALREYSGKLSIDKRIKELTEEKKATTSKVAQVQKYEAHLKKNFGEVQRLAKEAAEGKAEPLAAMEYLLDILGQDSFVYSKKVMESLFTEFEQLYDMSESEQKAYWTSKENSHLRKVSEKSRISQQKEQANQKVLAQVESAHEEFGVDWEQYNEALDELLTLKDERGNQRFAEKALLNNPRAVAQYAARMPYITKAESLIQPFEENIDDDKLVDLTDTVVGLLLESKGAKEADVKEWLETNYGVPASVKALNQRLSKAGGASTKEGDEDAKFRARTKKKDEDEVEDFDDFDF